LCCVRRASVSFDFDFTGLNWSSGFSIIQFIHSTNFYGQSSIRATKRMRIDSHS
jgi:hypothetical protein